MSIEPDIQSVSKSRDVLNFKKKDIVLDRMFLIYRIAIIHISFVGLLFPCFVYDISFHVSSRAVRFMTKVDQGTTAHVHI